MSEATHQEIESQTAHCNICGANLIGVASWREESDCPDCQSTPRMRSVIHALSLALYDGQSLPLKEWPTDPALNGLGCTDWDRYASELSARFAYVNTYYHREPFIDLTEPPSFLEGHYDFIICSEVIEHVPPPVEKSFNGLWQLLKPGGAVILTTPHDLSWAMEEHFPDLYDWSLEETKKGWVIRNITVSGESETYHDIKFHGGPGTTVEMRRFSTQALVDQAKEAGFEVEVLTSYEPWGLMDSCVPLILRKPKGQKIPEAWPLPKERYEQAGISIETDAAKVVLCSYEELLSDLILWQEMLSLGGADENVTVLIYSPIIAPGEMAGALEGWLSYLQVDQDLMPDCLIVSDFGGAPRPQDWARISDAVFSRNPLQAAYLSGRVCSSAQLVRQLLD